MHVDRHRHAMSMRDVGCYGKTLEKRCRLKENAGLITNGNQEIKSQLLLVVS